jgi:hypothetical protein
MTREIKIKSGTRPEYQKFVITVNPSQRKAVKAEQIEAGKIRRRIEEMRKLKEIDNYFL